MYGTFNADHEYTFYGNAEMNNALQVELEEKVALIDNLKETVLNLENELDHMWSFFPECCESIENSLWQYAC